MFRGTFPARAIMGITFGKNKTDFFTSLWNKPETKDERVKDYVPEVLAESLVEQRAVTQERTSRDLIVEFGHKVLNEIQNKSPTPSVSPHLNRLLLQYGAKDVIAQRPLSYLLYPSSTTVVGSGGGVPHDLVFSFVDNFRVMVEEVEQNGCSICRDGDAGTIGKRQNTTPSAAVEEAAQNDHKEERTHSAPNSGTVIMTSLSEHEPMDITMFIKVVSGMALANMHCGDYRNAVRCVDTAISHAIDKNRLGGLLGMKAGLMVHEKKFDEAVEAARLAVEASGNIQGYIHGAFALRRLGRPEEVVALLKHGVEEHPMNLELLQQLEAAGKEVKLSLPE